VNPLPMSKEWRDKYLAFIGKRSRLYGNQDFLDYIHEIEYGSIQKGPTESKNSSDFPDGWVRRIVEWLCVHFEIRHRFTLEIQNAKTRSDSGRYWEEYFVHIGDRVETWKVVLPRVFLRIRRDPKKFRKNWKYVGIAWDRDYRARTSTEAFVFLVAHELAHHSIEGRVAKYECKRTSGETGKADWRKRTEVRTKALANRALEEYRSKAWRPIIVGFMKEERIRRGRDRSSTAKRIAREIETKARQAQKKAIASTTDSKVAEVDRKIADWNTKRKRAETMLSKYRRKRSALLGAKKRKERVAL